MRKIDLEKKDLDLLLSILDKYRSDFLFFVFGSRVTGKAKKYSDIDIAFKPLNNTNTSIAPVRNTIEDSSFPLVVDFIDLHNIDDDFLEIINSQKVEI